MPANSSDRLVLIFVVIGVVGLFGCVVLPMAMMGAFLWIGPLGGFPDLDPGLQPGESAPALVAAGWLNGNAPTAESLHGRVVVVEAWASW